MSNSSTSLKKLRIISRLKAFLRLNRSDCLNLGFVLFFDSGRAHVFGVNSPTLRALKPFLFCVAGFEPAWPAIYVERARSGGSV